MMINYARPNTLDEAIKLMQKTDSKAVALAGGSTLIQKRFSDEKLTLVDLQALGLSKLDKGEDTLRIGAMVTLNELMEMQAIAPSLRRAVYLETNNNLRNTATIGGTLLSDGQQSCPLATAMLAMDTQLIWHPDQVQISLGEWLLHQSDFDHRILTQVLVPSNPQLALETISRSPADKVALCVAVCVWTSGRTRVVVSGASPRPVLTLDGPNSDGAALSANNAYRHYINLHPSPNYTKQMIAILTTRALASIAIGD